MQLQNLADEDETGGEIEQQDGYLVRERECHGFI